MKPNASIVVSLGIGLLAVVVLAAVAVAIVRSTTERRGTTRRFIVGSIAWLALTGALAEAGFFVPFDALPPRMLVVLLPVVLLPIWIARSSAGQALARHTPIAIWLPAGLVASAWLGHLVLWRRLLATT